MALLSNALTIFSVMQVLHRPSAMNLRQLRTLITVADAGGFARAASRLNLSQPAASRQIQGLENELGISLFDRIGSRMQLTSQGEEIVRRGRRVLQEADSLRDRADALRSGVVGTLRVGSSPQHIETVLAPFVDGFRLRHPGIDVHFVEDGGEHLNDRLEHGDVQIALITSRNELFLTRVLYPIYVLAVVGLSHPLARRTVVDIADLADEPLLLLQRSFGSRSWFDAACHSADISPPIVLESGAPATLVALAGRGHGVAILPSNVRIPPELKAMSVTYRDMAIARWALVAWDSRRFFPHYAQHFVDELKSQLRTDYPGRDLERHIPRLKRPRLHG
jgi:LysR family cyn operon transcriptional activator